MTFSSRPRHRRWEGKGAKFFVGNGQVLRLKCWLLFFSLFKKREGGEYVPPTQSSYANPS